MTAPNRPANDGIHSRSVIWRVEALHTRNPHIISNPLTNIRKAAAAAKSAKALFRFPDFNPMNSSRKKKQGADEKWCVTTEKLKNHSKNNGDFTGKSRHNQSQISLADLKQVIEQVQVHTLK